MWMSIKKIGSVNKDTKATIQYFLTLQYNLRIRLHPSEFGSFLFVYAIKKEVICL